MIFPQVVYVIGPEGGPFKIGCTNDLRTRLQGLQTGNHVKLVCHLAAASKDAMASERKLHSKFSAGRILGEWFDVALSDIHAAMTSLGLDAKPSPLGEDAIIPLPDEDVERLFRGEADADLFTRWRRAMGFNRLQSAEAIGISRNMPQRYEDGLAPIPLYIALACAALVRGIKPWPG